MTTKEIFQKQFTEDVINASQDTIFVFNPQTGKAVIWNKAFSKVSGYSDEEIKSLKAPNSYYNEKDLKKADSASKEVLKSGKTTVEMNLITKDGRTIPYEYSGTVLQGLEGNLLIVSVGRNISERKEIDRKLRESEEKFRNITEQSLMGISIIQDGQFKYFNERVLELSGYPSEEMKNWAPDEFAKTIHPEDREFVLEQARKKQAGEPDIVNQYQFRIIKKNGDIRWLEIYSKTINYEGSLADLVITIDITEKIKTEKKLRESEARYRVITENTNTVVWSTDMNLNLTFVSSNSPDILGYSVEEVKSIPLSERMTPESLRKMFKIFREELGIERKKDKNLNRSRTYEIDQIHKNGDIVPVEISFTFLRDENDKAIGIIGISQNISERKQAEQMLKESEEKYRKLFDNAPFLILLFNTEGFILDCNNQTSIITGYSKEELIDNNFRDFNFYVDITKANLDERSKQVSSGMVPEPRELLLYKKDGSQFWARIYVEFVNMGGETYIQAIIHDISEQKQARLKLYKSEQHLQERVKELNFLFGLTEIAEKSDLTINEFLLNIVNLIPTSMKFPDLSRSRILFDGHDYNSENFEISNWKLTSEIEINEKKLVIEIFYMENKSFLPEEENLIKELGKRLKVILEKKKSEKERLIAQKELAQSYERLTELEKIINNSPNVLFLWKNSEGWPVEFVSENIKQFGYTQDDFYSGKVIYEQIIHPDDLERVVEEVNHHIIDGANELMQEYRIITKSGEIKWLDDRTWVRRDSKGKITHFQGIVLDITYRKKTEQSLKLSERNYKDAYNMANFYKDLFTHDMNNILQIINSSAEIISFQLGDSEKSIFIENMTKMIKSQIVRGSKLISDVRTLTSLDENEISLEKIDISKFLKESIKFVKKAYTDRGLSIIRGDHNEKYYINANELLQDVFDNILINSVKYNENTVVEINIKICKVVIDKKDYIKIEFIDNGIGVEDIRKTLIFQPGQREIKGTKGMGMGLSLVSKIMEIFDGKIWVEDKVKGDYTQGSNFVLLLPKFKKV